MICIYHSRDLDGFASGTIVKRKYPDATLIGYDYGQPFPWEKIPEDEPIIMIDVSLPMVDMLKLSEHSGNFTWIDHHISAINEYQFFKETYTVFNGGGADFLTPVLENGIAACEVGWKYLFPDKEMPEAIRLLGEYDTWRNGNKMRWEWEVLPFQFGMRMKCNSPETFPVELLNQSESVPEYDAQEIAFRGINEIISNGKCILQYQAQINQLQCKKAAFEIEFEGLRAICLNGGGFNSDVFKSVYDENKHDIMMPFQFDGKQWTISLYTTKDHIDCSAIAKSKGGGGHKKAAGFQAKDISFLFIRLPWVGSSQ